MAARPHRNRSIPAAVAVAALPLLTASAVSPAAAAESDPGAETAASARFLAGVIGGTDLDAAAGLSGVAVSDVTDGGGAFAAQPVDPSVLDEIPVDVGGADIPLGDILQVVSADQWAAAEADVSAEAAVGAVAEGAGLGSGSDAGFTGDVNLDLTALVETALPEAISELSIELGGVSSAASVATSAEAELDYQISDGTITAAVPALSDVAQSVRDAVAAVGTVVDSLAGPDGQIAQLLGSLDAVQDLLDTLAALPGVEVTGPDIRVGLDLDVDRLVQTVLDTPLGEGTGVEINLADGTVVLDLDALVDGGLSGQAPNTDLLDPAFVQTVTQTLTDVVDGAAEQIAETVRAELAATELEVGLYAEVSTLLTTDILDVRMLATLDAVLAGEAEVVNESTGLVAQTVAPLLDELTTTIVEAVGGVLDDTVFGEQGALATLETTVATAVDAVAEALASLGETISALVSVQVNVQAGVDSDKQILAAHSADGGTPEVTAAHLDVPDAGVQLSIATATVSM